ARLVDDAHAAAAELFEHGVAPDLLLRLLRGLGRRRKGGRRDGGLGQLGAPSLGDRGQGAGESSARSSGNRGGARGGDDAVQQKRARFSELRERAVFELGWHGSV